jgi:tripartite-type tricarboxylate transporter receptor subunit TctC
VITIVQLPKKVIVMTNKSSCVVPGISVLFTMVALAGFSMSTPAHSQSTAFPSRPITMVVPYPAGATDLQARRVAEIASRSLGQNIVVTNRTGAGGAIGAQSVASSAADGYTLLYAAPAVITIVPLLGNAPYRYEDLTPLARVTTSPHVLAARADAPFSNLQELIRYGRANPGKIVFGSSGNGTAVHLAGEGFADAAGIQLNHVPHRGLAPAITAALGGFVDLVIGLPVAIGPQVQAGKLRAVAQFGASRAPGLDDVPTLKESGVNLVLGVDIGVFAPAGLPAPVVRRLEEAFAAAVRSDEFKTFAAKAKSTPGYLDSAGYRAVVESERKLYARLVPALKLKAN